MGSGLLRAAGFNGWGGGLRFPCAETAGATITGPLTQVPSGATSGTGWTWQSAQNQIKITTAGANVSGLAVAGGCLIQANNVTVSNCTFTAAVSVGSTSSGTVLSNLQVTNSGASAAGITLGSTTTNSTVTRCTISGTDASGGRLSYGVQDSSNDANTVVTYCNIWWCRIFGSAAAGTWASNYMHDSGFQLNDHNDGIDCEGTNGHSLLVQGNTILVPLSQTSPLHMSSTFSAVTNATVTGNLLAGGDYCIYAGNTGSLAASSQGVVVAGNWFSTMFFSTGGFFGAGTAYSATATGNAWSNNRWLDGPSAGQLIAHP
jgi:hypothetical protein